MDTDAVSVLNSEIIEYWFNGFYSSLTFGTLWVIVSRKQDDIVKKCVWIGLTLSMYISSTVHSSLNWNHLVNSVKDSVDGRSPTFATTFLHPSAKIEIAGSVFFALNIAMADMLLAWRCWIVWQRRWYFALIPVAGCIAGIVLAALAIHTEVLLQDANVAVNIIQEHSKFFESMSNAFFSLSIATSLATTVLITLRILLVQNASRQAGLKESRYSGVIEIIVESAALYSITLLLFVIFESKHSVLLYFPQEIHAQVSGIAPTLIILRVASGHSRPESDWGTKQSTLKFASSEMGSLGSDGTVNYAV